MIVMRQQQRCRPRTDGMKYYREMDGAAEGQSKLRATTPLEKKKQQQQEINMGGDWGPVLIAVVFFVVLTPGLLCQIPGNGNGRVAEFHSMKTSGIAIFVHTIIFFAFCAIFMVAIGVHLYAG